MQDAELSRITSDVILGKDAKIFGLVNFAVSPSAIEPR